MQQGRRGLAVEIPRSAGFFCDRGGRLGRTSGPRLPEEEDEQAPPGWQSFKRKLADVWAQVAVI
jgi:hypothetical protein